jgi:hypothetical protein
MRTERLLKLLLLLLLLSSPQPQAAADRVRVCSFSDYRVCRL